MSWLEQARKRNQRLGAIPYDGGTGSPKRLDLRNTGYLTRLRLTQTISGTYGTAGPSAVDAFGNYGGALRFITVGANSVGNLFTCSGAMAAVISAIDNHYQRSQNLLVPTNTVVTASPGTSAFADQWLFDIPTSIDFANKPTPMGLFQTALNSQETYIEVLWNPVSATTGVPGSGIYVPGGGATGPNPAGSLDIQQVYFDPIADPNSQPILGYIHRWREWQAGLTADGDNEIPLNPSNYYLRILIWVITGAAGALAPDSTHVTRLRLVYGANLAPFDETAAAVLGRQSNDYGFALPAGVWSLDFINETHTERDVINSSATTNLRLVITTSGATYSGGAYARIAVEELVPLVVPKAGTPGVQGAAA